MKKLIHASALLGLVLGCTSAFAEVTYGPVITIKPKGVAAQPAQSQSKPQAPAGKSVKKGKTKGEPIQGALDRDIIRRTVPSKPKPK